MIHPGLVSVTFRQLEPSAIIDLVVRAGLVGIEWGGDIHVPHGDVNTASTVGMMTVEAGLQVAAYGSYYRVGHTDEGLFEASLETAYALGAPVIRVWPGKQGSDTSDETYWDQVIADSQRIADFAMQADIKIAYEFHAKTLTDTTASTQRLLEAVDHHNIVSLWQTPRYSVFDDNMIALDTVLPRLHNVHVFHWHQETGERHALSEGAELWQQYFAKLSTSGRDHFALLEFVRDDNPMQFLEDAATLNELLSASS
ncbi:MAG: TIM barrel protein [Chloroflexota bacterium]